MAIKFESERIPCTAVNHTSKMRLFWGSLTGGGRICESNHKGVFSEKRSGHIFVQNTIATFI